MAQTSEGEAVTKLPKAESPATEAQTQRLILDWLAAKGILAFRMQSGATVSSYKGKTRLVRYGTPGMSDILAFPELWIEGQNSIGRQDEVRAPVPVWIECKALKGKQSELQKSFQQQVEAHGHRYVLAYSLEDVIAALQ